MEILPKPFRLPECPPLGHRVMHLTTEEDDYAMLDNTSKTYFRARKNGFIELQKLHITPEIAVRLMTTVDNPRELVVVKRFFRYLKWEARFRYQAPAEFSYSTLKTPYTLRHLSLGDELLPVAYTHAILAKDFNPAPSREDDPLWDERPTTNLKDLRLDASIWFKYYNGGTLAEMLWHFQVYKRKVPEIFIWHFIADYGRAMAYIHNGTYRSRAYNVKKYLHRQIGLDTPIRSPRARDWLPICHSDAHESNAFFHYPTPEERRLDPRLNRYSDEFPQCILGDFGQAGSLQDRRGNMFQHEFFAIDEIRPREIATWLDKARFGNNIKGLVLASRMDSLSTPIVFDFPIQEMAASRSDKRLEERCRRNGIKDAERAALEMKQAVRGYSRELIDLVSRFECIIPMSFNPERKLGVDQRQLRGRYQVIRDAIWRAHELAQDPEYLGGPPWDKWPSNDFLYGTVIAMADVKMEQYKRGTLRWDRLPSLRNIHAAPLNMKAEASLYLHPLAMEERIPNTWTGDAVAVAHNNGRKETFVMEDDDGYLAEGAFLTYPTGEKHVKYMTYHQVAPKKWPQFERKFHYPGKVDELTGRFEDEQPPTHIPANWPYVGGFWINWGKLNQRFGGRGYHEHYNYLSPEKSDSPEPESEPDSPTLQRKRNVFEVLVEEIQPVVGLGGLDANANADDVQDKDKEQAEGSLVPSTADGHDGKAPEEPKTMVFPQGLGGFRRIPAEEASSILVDLWYGRRTLDIDHLETLQKMVDEGTIGIDLSIFNGPQGVLIARDIIRAAMFAKPAVFPIGGEDTGDGGTGVSSFFFFFFSRHLFLF